MRDEVQAYLYCGLCNNECPDGADIRPYLRISVGRTKDSLLIFCDRHNKILGAFKVNWMEEFHCTECSEDKKDE